MTELRNYTPHDPLVYRRPDADAIVLPQRGLARCREFHAEDGSFDEAGEFPRTLVGYAEVSDLPDPEPGVVYVVSQLVVAACPDRTDLAFPAGLLRDDAGSITGFSLLARPA